MQTNLLHRPTDDSCSLARQWHFSVRNNSMAAIMKFWRKIENMTPINRCVHTLKNNTVKFHTNPIWNDRALGFFSKRSPRQEQHNNNININQLVLWDPPVNYSISRRQGSTSNPRHSVSRNQLSGTFCRQLWKVPLKSPLSKHIWQLNCSLVHTTRSNISSAAGASDSTLDIQQCL